MTFYNFIVKKTIETVDESMKRIMEMIEKHANEGLATLVLPYDHRLSSGQILWLRANRFNVFNYTDKSGTLKTHVISWEHADDEKAKVEEQILWRIRNIGSIENYPK